MTKLAVAKIAVIFPAPAVPGIRRGRRAESTSNDTAICTSLRSSIPRTDIEARSRKQAIDNKYDKQAQTLHQTNFKVNGFGSIDNFRYD
jgi:hypothetical protein